MIKVNYNKNILLVTGGTGGHIYPAISIYKYLKNNSYKVNIITDKRGLKNKNLAIYKPFLINVKGYSDKKILEKFYSLILVLFSTVKAILYLRKENINLICGFGSYVQVPVLIAAKILKIDFILHEANAVLGKANKVFWKFARVRTSFYELGISNFKIIKLGMPVRPNIEKLYKKNYLAFKRNSNITILILGGSLGSEALSLNIAKSLCLLPDKLKNRLKLVHQVKKNYVGIVAKKYKENNIKARVEIFINNIENKLKVANLIICRAGASTIAENLIAGVPAIYIPLNFSSNDHQYFNALKITKSKVGWLIREKEIASSNFVKFINEILLSPNKLKIYSDNCKKHASPKATQNLYKVIVGLND